MPITTIACARAALAAIKKNGRKQDQEHYDTVSNDTLGQRVTKMEKEISDLKKS